MNTAKPFTARIPADLLRSLHSLQLARSERERHRIPMYFLIAEALERYIAQELTRFSDVA